MIRSRIAAACAGVAIGIAWGFDPGSEAFRLQKRDVPSTQPSSNPPELVDVPPDSNEARSAAIEPEAAAARPSPVAAFATGRLVRVALDEGKAVVTCELRGPWIGPSGQKLTGKATARLDPQGVVLETMTAKLDLGQGGVLRTETGSFCFGAKCFRGQARFERLGNGIALVNQLSLEDYLLGVVPGEIGRRLDPRFAEAVRAQAIVARTYTLRSLGQYTGKPWDVRDDVRDQVYDGLKGEDPLCTRAVRSTTGQILTDASGKPIDAYYHSTSGGHTADIRDAWPGKTPQTYLSGVDDTAPDGRAWGGAALVAEWAERWPVGELHEAVRRDLSEALGRKLDPGPVKALRLEGRDASGRARKLVVDAENGTFEVPADRIRWALRRPVKGRPILRSTRFELDLVDGEYIAEGTGYGHGVGMSQNGAMGRAFAGQTYQQILSAYYPGTVLRTIDP